MRYSVQRQKRRWPRRLTVVLLILLTLIVGATVTVRQLYYEKLKPVSLSRTTTVLFTVESGASLDQIALNLEEQNLIQSAWAFKLYVSSKQVRSDLQAGTYSLAQSQSVEQIVEQLTHGKVATNSVIILPGQRLLQVKASLMNQGFSERDVDAALDASQYLGNPALVDKPAAASLEGYLFPDTFEKDNNTTAKDIVMRSLTSMQAELTPDLRSAFAKQGLSTYDAIKLASIVEKEAATNADRYKVAQVFLLRLRQNMSLGSDPTAFYGAIIDGRPASLTYDSPYNTRIYKGLPPTPISNVSKASLLAVANPADTDWLYFVAGDDGTVHYSRTLEDHEALTDRYCHKLCGRD